jgi:hypothetical protein
MEKLENIVKGEFFIRLEDNEITEENAREHLESTGISVVHRYVTGVYQVRVPEEKYEESMKKLEELKEKKYIKSIEPVYKTGLIP